jgi:hypothetical protein
MNSNRTSDIHIAETPIRKAAASVLALALDRLVKLLRNRRTERIPENMHA